VPQASSFLISLSWYLFPGLVAAITLWSPVTNAELCCFNCLYSTEASSLPSSRLPVLLGFTGRCGISICSRIFFIISSLPSS